MSVVKRRAPGATRRRGRRREVHAPRASFEELEIRTEDGVALRAVLDDPPDGVVLRGTCVLAHAMFGRKTEFGHRERAGLAQTYAAAGWRTIAFDFRGHGDSALPRAAREWGYDDLVRRDLPAVVACARDRGEGRPVVVVGHSLGGDVALAAQGTGRMAADALVVIAASVWLRAFERSKLRWAAKRALALGMQEAAERFGRLPARALRLGSDDASARFVGDLVGFMRDERWRSEDGTDDYLASLARVTVPVCAVASTGDRLACHPASAEAFARRCGGPLRFLCVSRSEDGRPAPGHMALVTSDRARSSLVEALAWVEWRAARAAHARP
jgi:predicted alpha/beta hydrolase